MKYQLTYRDYKTEDVDCDGMQTAERFTMFVYIDKITSVDGEEQQQPTATPILIVHNDEIRSIRNVTPQVAKPVSRIH
jgi:hypothetical protein